MTSLEIQQSKCRKLAFTKLQIVIYVAPKSSLILKSFLLYKSAVTNSMNVADITQQRDKHLVKCNLHGKRFNHLKPRGFFTYHKVKH